MKAVLLLILLFPVYASATDGIDIALLIDTRLKYCEENPASAACSVIGLSEYLQSVSIALIHITPKKRINQRGGHTQRERLAEFEIRNAPAITVWDTPHSDRSTNNHE